MRRGSTHMPVSTRGTPFRKFLDDSGLCRAEGAGGQRPEAATYGDYRTLKEVYVSAEPYFV